MNLKQIRPIPMLFVLLMLATACDAQDQPAAGYRHWTTSSGRRSDVRLKLIDSVAGKVRLQREDNGKVITLPESRLSDADQKFLARATRPAPNPPVAAATDDWPQWRGPNRDGKSLATGLLKQWPSDGPRLLWNVTGLGEGYSTPAVSGDVVYVLGTRGNAEFIFALQTSDGSQLWESRIGTKGGGGGFPGPKGAPTVDGDEMYAIGSDGTLVCVRRDGGQQVWRKNLKLDFGGKHGNWEYAESPLIDGDKLICTPGGGNNTLVALRKSNGAPIWNAAAGRLAGEGYTTAAYASTIMATIAGTRQYIAFLNGGVIGVAADSGRPLWHYDSPANGTANCSTPVVHGDSVFAASAYGKGGGRADIARRGSNWNVDEAYFVKKMESHHGGFILHDGHIYGTNGSVLMCLDWNSGQIEWQDRSVGKGSVTFADGHLYVRGENGQVALVEATPDEYREKGRFRQTDRSNKNAWAHPVVAGGRLYLHDADRLLCYEVK